MSNGDDWYSIPDPPNFDDIPGYHGQHGVPDNYISDEIRRWTANACDVAFFGTHRTGGGFGGIRSLHPMRAKDLLNVVVVTEPHTDYGTWSAWVPNLCYPNAIAILVPDAPPEIDEDADVSAIIQVYAMGDLDGIQEYVDVYGGHLGQIFLGRLWEGPSGEPGGGVYGENVGEIAIDAGTYNAVMGYSVGGYLDLIVRPAPYVDLMCENSGARGRLGISYQGDTTQKFANTEVCYHHFGYGFVRDGHGFARPETLIQVQRDEKPVVSRGAVWRCQEDSEDELAFGEQGFFVLAIPVETPPTLPFVFESYPRRCGDEY